MLAGHNRMELTSGARQQTSYLRNMASRLSNTKTMSTTEHVSINKQPMRREQHQIQEDASASLTYPEPKTDSRFQRFISDRSCGFNIQKQTA